MLFPCHDSIPLRRLRQLFHITIDIESSPASSTMRRPIILTCPQTTGLLLTRHTTLRHLPLASSLSRPAHNSRPKPSIARTRRQTTPCKHTTTPPHRLHPAPCGQATIARTHRHTRPCTQADNAARTQADNAVSLAPVPSPHCMHTCKRHRACTHNTGKTAMHHRRPERRGGSDSTSPLPVPIYFADHVTCRS